MQGATCTSIPYAVQTELHPTLCFGSSPSTASTETAPTAPSSSASGSSVSPALGATTSASPGPQSHQTRDWSSLAPTTPRVALPFSAYSGPTLSSSSPSNLTNNELRDSRIARMEDRVRLAARAESDRRDAEEARVVDSPMAVLFPEAGLSRFGERASTGTRHALQVNEPSDEVADRGRLSRVLPPPTTTTSEGTIPLSSYFRPLASTSTSPPPVISNQPSPSSPPPTLASRLAYRIPVVHVAPSPSSSAPRPFTPSANRSTNTDREARLARMRSHSTTFTNSPSSASISRRHDPSRAAFVASTSSSSATTTSTQRPRSSLLEAALERARVNVAAREAAGTGTGAGDTSAPRTRAATVEFDRLRATVRGYREEIERIGVGREGGQRERERQGEGEGELERVLRAARGALSTAVAFAER